MAKKGTKIIEKNVNEFNKDASNTGNYLYANKNKLSSRLATERQTVEIINLLKKHTGKNVHILDVGCGDGTYTFEIYKKFKSKKIIAFDVAESAIKIARKNNKYKNRIHFFVANIYDVSKKLKNKKIDIIVVRGVLHHVYKPKEAIKELSTIANKIIVLEPNGYNPLLKIIEKISPYHIAHEEKSYWPPLLNNWFEKYMYAVEDQKFFVIVPYFFPDILTKMLKATEPFFESIPLLHKIYCGTNIIYFEKKRLFLEKKKDH